GDAIERGDMSDLREELGDLLSQVVFHSQIAKENGAFTFEEVVNGICDKMERRHPHVFGTASITSAAEHTKAREAQKRNARARSARGVLDGVPHALPPLTRAGKLGKRAAEVGFEWPDTQGALDKVAEELDELRAELSRSSSPERLANELGDVLFSILNVCRPPDADPETALRRANANVDRRLRYVEERLREQGKSPAEATLEEMDVLWE